MNAPRNPWPWGIGLFLAAFFVSMIIFVVWSLGHRQDLVAENYYERDLTHQETIDSLARAQELGYPTLVRLQDGSFEVRIQPGASNPVLTLYRPSDARLDITNRLEVDELGQGRWDPPRLEPGRWRAILEWEAEGLRYRSEMDFAQ
ncbi:MAG: FixH family protein [Kiritimatiellae bacterium]|nr:FixH family protein [Kiritimatiellia bacterium]MDW8458327.1 FixH family protein [Verrucomicrobiota bacterium]